MEMWRIKTVHYRGFLRILSIIYLLLFIYFVYTEMDKPTTLPHRIMSIEW